MDSKISSTFAIQIERMRGGAEVARRAHNPKVVGSSPAPATKAKAEGDSSAFFYLLSIN